MTTYEVSMVVTWAALVGMVAKYMVDAGKTKKRIAGLRVANKNTDEAIAKDRRNCKKHREELRAEILAASANTASSLQKDGEKLKEDFAELKAHIRDKIAEYGTTIAQISFQVKAMEEKFQLNALELEEVEYALEGFKDVIEEYYEFLIGFMEEFGLDDSKLYSELVGRTKVIQELVEEIIGRVREGKNGTNNKNGVRTVATIGTIKTGQAQTGPV